MRLQEQGVIQRDHGALYTIWFWLPCIEVLLSSYGCQGCEARLTLFHHIYECCSVYTNALAWAPCTVTIAPVEIGPCNAVSLDRMVP